MADRGDDGTWISVVDRADLLVRAKELEEQVDPASAPLYGIPFAVKDNIDVAGLPTTAGCPAYAFDPEQDAAVVARLRAAGSVVLGKTNLDQFATGLVGTRSPYGAVRAAAHRDRIAGGSSSGSAVAVALGIVDVALGTDTAGSGRIPAAFQGIVGVKPSRGLLPLHGVVPAVRSLDCVSVFAAGLDLALRTAAVLAGPDPRDPYSRTWPPQAPLAAPDRPRVAVAGEHQLGRLSAEALARYEDRAAELEKAGATLVAVDVAPFLDAATLLYDGSFVAARYAAVGAFADAHPEALDPIVGPIIRRRAGHPRASAGARRGTHRAHRRAGRRAFRGCRRAAAADRTDPSDARRRGRRPGGRERPARNIHELLQPARPVRGRGAGRRGGRRDVRRDRLRAGIPRRRRRGRGRAARRRRRRRLRAARHRRGGFRGAPAGPAAERPAGRRAFRRSGDHDGGLPDVSGELRPAQARSGPQRGSRRRGGGGDRRGGADRGAGGIVAVTGRRGGPAARGAARPHGARPGAPRGRPPGARFPRPGRGRRPGCRHHVVRGPGPAISIVPASPKRARRMSHAATDRPRRPVPLRLRPGAHRAAGDRHAAGLRGAGRIRGEPGQRRRRCSAASWGR